MIAPSLERIEEIVARDGNPVLRNLLITQGYHDLAAGMTQVLGPGNGTWSMFGVWASKTAGGFIRGDELPAAVRLAVTSSPEVQQRGTLLTGALHEVAGPVAWPIEVAERLAGRLASDVALYIQQGNKVVFEEMGGSYARFLAFAGGPDTNRDAFECLLSQFEPGPVLPDKVTLDWATRTITTERQGGQSLLREMLAQYAAAVVEKDPRRKAQTILYANALGGIHEQTRLQPYIAASIDVPIDDFVREALHEQVAEAVTDRGVLHAAYATLDRLVHPLAHSVRRVWQECSTMTLMSMRLPDGTLHLGRDVPALPGGPLFPPQLAQIALDDLAAVLSQYGALSSRHRTILGWCMAEAERLVAWGLGRRLPRDVAGSAARDWVSLSQRMRYILDFFRSRQQDAALALQPFDDGQRRAIAEGVVPDGPL